MNNNKTTKSLEITYPVMKCFHGNMKYNCEFMKNRKTVAKNIDKNARSKPGVIKDSKPQEIG